MPTWFRAFSFKGLQCKQALGRRGVGGLGFTRLHRKMGGFGERGVGGRDVEFV